MTNDRGCNALNGLRLFDVVHVHKKISEFGDFSGEKSHHHSHTVKGLILSLIIVRALPAASSQQLVSLICTL